MKSNVVQRLQLQHQLFSTHTVRYQFPRVEEVCFYSFLETVCSICTFKLIRQTVLSHRCTSIHIKRLPYRTDLCLFEINDVVLADLKGRFGWYQFSKSEGMYIYNHDITMILFVLLISVSRLE